VKASTSNLQSPFSFTSLPGLARPPPSYAFTNILYALAHRPVAADAVRKALESAPGITIIDDPAKNQFPEPLNASGKDNVMVGRIRPDPSLPPGIGYSIFVAGDQIRKVSSSCAPIIPPPPSSTEMV
jgi:aspartate-semialdehyde dehydrogenase